MTVKCHLFLPATSISFPGMGGAGERSASALTRPSALMRMMDMPGLELSAKERVMAMWNFQHHRYLVADA
jgi:hypothetical protein